MSNRTLKNIFNAFSNVR